jgi:hypothetical protein
VRTLILIGTAFGLGAGLVCTSLFAWWLSYPVHFYVGSHKPLGAEGTTGHMDAVDPIPVLAAGGIFSAVLGAVSGFVAARRGWQDTVPDPGGSAPGSSGRRSWTASPIVREGRWS